MLNKAIIGLAMMIGSTSAHADRQTCFDILKSELEIDAVKKALNCAYNQVDCVLLPNGKLDHQALEGMIKDLKKAAAYDLDALPKYSDAIARLRSLQIDAAFGRLRGR
jgi:hypothetical protein